MLKSNLIRPSISSLTHPVTSCQNLINDNEQTHWIEFHAFYPSKTTTIIFIQIYFHEQIRSTISIFFFRFEVHFLL